MFRSYEDYGISYWDKNACPDMKKTTIILQKCAVRLIDNTKTMTHRYPIFLKYHILTINYMVDLNRAMFLFKYTNGLQPDSCENIFTS